MNIEVIDGLESRAAKHAALSDPARLRITDLLTLSDLSPTELRQELGIESNLLAHHLKVLESAGLVARSRSEGDRRRFYVHLRAEALASLGPSAVAAARRVVFVCTANSARSQLAAALWSARSAIPAVSAGTHPAESVAPGAVAAAKRRGLDFEGTPPRQLDDVLTADDFVVTVCDNAHEEVPLSALHWSVPDPVAAATDAAFDAALSDLSRRVDILAPHLTRT